MSVRCPVLVGRQAHTDRLASVLLRARQGRGGVVIVSGEAGIGKSRLVRHALADAGRAGLTCLVGRGVPTGSPVPLRPLVEAMLAAGRRGLLPDRGHLGAFGAALGRIVPEWSTVGPVHVQANAAPVLGEGLLRLFAAMAPPGVVLLLEDLHWADAETLSVVEYLCDHVADARLAVLLTLRTGVSAEAWAVAEALIARGAAESLPLGPLDDSDVAEMVRACGLEDIEGVRSAEGVPLLVEELLEEPGDRGVPRTFAATVRRRVLGLGARHRRILLAAAMVGRRVDWPLVGMALLVPDEDLTSALQAGIRCGVLENHGPDIRFRHALTRDALLAELAGPERAELASLLARAVADLYPDLRGDPHALAVDLAVQSGDHDRAADLQLDGGVRAVREGAMDSAIRQLQGGLGHARARPLRIELAERLADALGRVGRIDEAADATRVFLTETQDQPDQWTRRPAVRLRLARAAASAARWDLASTELLAAETAPPARDSAVGIEAGLVRAMLQLGRHDPAAARRTAAGLVDPALELGEPELACTALEVVGRVARLAEPEAAATAFGRALAIAVEHGLPLQELSALHELGTIDMFTTGRLDRLFEARKRAVAAGAVSTVAVLDLQLVPAHVMHGDAAAARAAALRAIDEATSLGLDGVRDRVVTFLSHTSALYADRAAVEVDIAAVPATVLAADPDAEAGVWGTGRGICSLLAEDRVAAVSEFETAARIAATVPPAERSPHAWWGFWVLLRAVEGRDARAAVAALRSCPAVSNRQNLAAAELAEAVLLGRIDEGARAAAIVATLGPREMPWIWQRQLARRLVAEAALRDGWGSPSAWLEEAARFFDGFPAPSVADACRGLSGVDRSTMPARLREVDVTPREFEVYALLADGGSNRDVARCLGISPRTAEKHVESLCRKLGVAGRGPLIALAADGARR